MCARDKLSEGLSSSGDMSEAKRTKMSKLVQYYRLKQKHNLLRGDGVAVKSNNVYTADWLAMSTAYAKLVFQFILRISNILNTIVTRFVPDISTLKKFVLPSILCLLTVLVALKLSPERTVSEHRTWKTLYVLSFAIHFGAQVWMTFVSGIVLYFSIPRHVFGQIQEVLFPFYYLFNSIGSLVCVVSFINMQHSISLLSDTFKQVIALTACLSIELLIRLYVAKVIVMLKQKKTRIEAEAGTGQEIGHQILGELANCPHYMGILRSFRRMHSYTSVATIMTVMCTLYHLNFLIDKLCL